MRRFLFFGLILAAVTFLGCATFETKDPRIQGIIIEPESGRGEFRAAVHYSEGREPGDLVCEYPAGEDAQTGTLTFATEEGVAEDILVLSFEFNLTKPGKYLVSCRIDPFPDSGFASRFTVEPGPEDLEEDKGEEPARTGFNTDPSGRPLVIRGSGTLTEYFYPQLVEEQLEPPVVTTCDSAVEATLTILTSGSAELAVEGEHYVAASCAPSGLQPFGLFAQATVDPDGAVSIMPPHTGSMRIVDGKIEGSLSAAGSDGRVSQVITFAD